MVGLTLQLLQLFLIFAEDLWTWMGYQCLQNLWYFLQVSFPTIQSMFLLRIVLCLYHDYPTGCCSCLHEHTISVTIQHHSFLSYMTWAWGMPASFVHSLFLHTSWKVGSYRFLSPSNGSLLILSLSLSFTMTLSIEETLMNFGYTYAPNLIHHGASVITEISSANGYKNPTPLKTPISSFMAQTNAFPKGKLYNWL